MLALISAIPTMAQSDYITNSRDENEDCLYELDGQCGLLILSKNKNLVIRVTNLTYEPKIMRQETVDSDGFYRYIVAVNADDRKINVNVGRMSDLYTTEFVASVKPDYLVAYMIDEVEEPIRIEDDGGVNDVILDATKGAIEFTTTISGLNIVCDERLGATIHTETDKIDPNKSNIDVVFPIENLLSAKKEFDDLSAEFKRLSDLISSDKATDADDERYDEVEKSLKLARNKLSDIATVMVYSDKTNRISINISDMGPRAKKCYIVMPVEVTKEVFVTEANAFVTEGGRLFDQRKYADARVAYVNALNAKDVQLNSKPTISACIALCDTCMEYEKLAAIAINKILEMRDNNTATQQQTAKYASAAIEFLNAVNICNPDIFYTSRIEKLEKMLKDLPLMVTFTTIEWRTFEEGDPIPNVEVWAYYGSTPPTPSELSSVKKLKRTMDKASELYIQKGVSDENGKLRMELTRDKLPAGFIFCPTTDSDVKAVYLSFGNLMYHAKGTYTEKQFRLKMYKKTNKYF